MLGRHLADIPLVHACPLEPRQLQEVLVVGEVLVSL